MTAEQKGPRNPLSFQIKAAARSVVPLLRTGSAYMPPLQFPTHMNNLRRWGFSVAALYAGNAIRYPDRIALVDDEGELTYPELHEQALALSRAMIDLGMGSKTSFGVVARNGRGIILPMAVKGYTGAEIMLMNIGSSGHQINGIADRNDVKFLFIDDEFLDNVPQDRPDLTVIITSVTDPETRNKVPSSYLFMEDLIEAGRTSAAKLEDRPAQGRIIIMSSGTTGIPKGVLRDEPKTPSSAGAIAERIPWRRNMAIHQSASMFHAWGWANVILAAATGATLITMRKFDAQKCFEQCQKYGVSGMISAAFFLRQLNDYLDAEPQRKIGPFKFIVSSGNAIPAWLVSALTDRFGPVVCNFYGSTEAGLTSIATGPDLARKPASAGRPAIGARVRILDDEGNAVKTGEVGHIYTAQEMSFTGYLDKKDRFTTIDGLYEIGDLGRFDEEGYLYVCGRADDMVIKGGENIYPREVEEILGPLDGVADLFCYGENDDDELFASLYLYVVREDNAEGTALTAKMLQEHIRENLSEPSVPDHVYFVDRLPRNANGKVVPREVKKMHEELGLGE